MFLANGEDGLFAFAYSSTATDVRNDPSLMPDNFEILQNYPNPFNPTTTINYALPIAGHVELKIYNAMGQEIRTLVNSMMPAGTQQAVWNSRDDSGSIVPSGVYFYQLQAGAFVETRKMLLIR